LIEVLEEQRDAALARAEAAETKVAKLREALTPFIRMTPVGGGDGGTFTVEPPTGEMINIARTALQETEQ
jgi:hypothetical protein